VWDIVACCLFANLLTDIESSDFSEIALRSAIALLVNLVLIFIDDTEKLFLA
jgi:hypothetical protein